MMQMLDDDDVVEAQRKGKECVEDGNDMADCLCDDDIGGLMESKLQASGCCEANELFWEMCYNRKCEAVPGTCWDIVEPCECGATPGCGWESESKSCVAGGATDCTECPHSLLCHGGDEHDVCASALFKNPDVLEAINQAKVCMQSERDGMEYCLRHASHKLKDLIEAVEWNGDTINCCDDNKFFSMVREGPVAKATTTTAAPAPAETPEAPEEPEAEEPEDEEPATTTTTTTTLDLMAEIERLAQEYGLVTTTPAPDGSSDGDDSGDGSGDDSGDGSGDGSDGGAGGAAGGDGDGAAAETAAADGGATSGALDQAAKNTADQVSAANDINAEEEDPVLT